MNGLKTAVLMAALTIILVLMGAMVGGEHGALLMLILSLGMNFFSYWFSDKIVLKMYGAQPVTREESPNLYGLVEDLSKRAGLPMPKVCIIESNVPNAFATGRNPSHAAVAVTTGIMQVLSYEELAGVLAHELSHIQHRDTLISTVAASIAGVISTLAMFAKWGAIFGSGRDRENSNPIAVILVAIIAPIAAAVIQMAISRSREYSADQRGGEICGNPLYLANALEKIEYYARHQAPLEHAGNATAHLFIINPFSGKNLSALFSTHPQTQDRIAKLRAQAQERGITSVH